MAPEVSRVIRLFESISRRYDFLNTLLSFGLHHTWKRSAIRRLGLKRGFKVLDLCGGTGDLTLLAGNHLDGGGIIVLYDVTSSMIELAREKVEKRAQTAEVISYIQGDASALALADSSFDAVMVGFGIRNLPDPEVGLREVFRILRPGGVFVCLEFSLPSAPVLRGLYDMYSFYVMPTAGRLFAGSREAYLYLAESIRTFVSPQGFSQLLNEVGFREVKFWRHLNGIAVTHLAIKPSAVGPMPSQGQRRDLLHRV